MKKNKRVSKQSRKNSKGGDIRKLGPSDEDLGLSPLQVKVYNNFDRAFKAFRTLVQSERILSLYKEKQFYEKPSDKKRRKRNEMRKRMLDLESKQRRYLSGELDKSKEKKQIEEKNRRNQNSD